MTETEVCALYLSQGDHGDLCVQATGKSALDYPEADIALRCRRGTDGSIWATDLLDSYHAGRVVIDWAAARECLRQSRSLRASRPGVELLGSDDWWRVENEICASVYQGAIIDGETCKQDWDCAAAGSACFSDRPFDPNSTRCMPPAALAAPCNDYHPCDDGLYCAAAGACAALGAAGNACNPELWGADCASGTCNETTTTCDAAPATTEPKPLGAPCNDSNECTGACVACRAVSLGARKTCARLGGLGDYCETWLECVGDLGCTARTCTTVGENSRCGPGAESVCNPDLSCVPPVLCSQFDETACANEPTCAYDDDTLECYPSEGRCITLPSQGACAQGWACATGSYCRFDPDQYAAGVLAGQCQAVARENEPCSGDGVDAALCQDGLTCVAGRCVRPCEYREDCDAGSYCDFSGDVPTCAPLTIDACTTSDACADGYWCDLPDASGCYEYANDVRQRCDADPACLYKSYESCVAKVECWPFDGKQDECEGNGCSYEAETQWCNSVAKCADHDNASDCGADTACAWDVDGWCGRQTTLAGTCAPRATVGQECTDADACESGDCAIDADGVSRCAVALSGCNRDASMVRLTFLFGIVWAVGRRRRGRGTREMTPPNAQRPQ